MKSKVSIFTDEWCDIIFKDKNKDYGACANRKSSPKNHLIAIITTGVFFSFSLCFPFLIKGSDSNKKMRIEDKTKFIKAILEDPIFIPKPVKVEPPKITAFNPREISLDILIGNEEKLPPEPVGSLNPNHGPGNDTIIFSNPNLGKNEIKIIPEKIGPVIFANIMPEFPGGESEMLSFLRKNIEYPSDAREMNVQGTVYVNFVVNTDGSISDIKIVRGVFASCDNEALRVMKMMPNWKPGKQNGLAVSVYFNLPISYVLK
jgi:protein TonB